MMLARNGRLWVVIGCLGLLGLLLGGCGSTPESIPAPSPIAEVPEVEVVAPEVGAKAPDFTLPTLGGGSIALSDFRGKPVLLNFWATWCGPCRMEMPDIQAVFEERAGQGLAVLTVNLGEDQSSVQEFLKKGGYTFVVAIDSHGQVAKDYRVRAIPTTFIIDKDGIIHSVKIGAFRSEAEIIAELEGVM